MEKSSSRLKPKESGIKQQAQVVSRVPPAQLPEQKVAGQLVAKNWLKGAGDQEPSDYRQKLHAAFERAQLQMQLRKLSSKNWDMKEAIMQRIQVLSEKLPQDYDQKQKLDHSQCNPEMPDLKDEKHKLVKISRSCGKNPIERFFNIDPKTEQFIYYVNDKSIKPKKKLNLLDARISIEHYDEVLEKEKKWWSDNNNKYRVGIGLKIRKYIPVYYYTQSLHDAKCVKFTIEYVLNHDTILLRAGILSVNEIYRVKAFQALFGRMLTLQAKRIQLQSTYSALNQISMGSFQVEKRQMMIEWSKEAERRALLMQKVEEPQIEQPKVPKIWSTVRHGQVRMMDYFLLKTFSRVERLMMRVKQQLMKRKAQRDPTIQDMLRKKNMLKKFQCNGGQYRVSDSILENMHRIGDIPYVITDIANISAIKVEGDNLIIFDNGKHEYMIPLNEISYMATNYGYKNNPVFSPRQDNSENYKLQLRGRKINQNVEMVGENVLSQQIGLERWKASRLTTKSVMRINLKRILIPALIRDQLQDRIVLDQDQVMLRLRFEVGEFHCYTPPFELSKNQTLIGLNGDITLDLHDSKYVKISVVVFSGRAAPNTQRTKIINEYVNEQLLCSVNLRSVDFADQLRELIYHIPFDSTKNFYNPKDSKANGNNTALIELTAACALIQVNGAYLTQHMEGPQLLIGKLCIHNKLYVSKVISVNKNNTCTVQILDTQPGMQHLKNKLIVGVSIKQDITLIEKYGISVLNMENLPQNYQHGQFEWNLDLTLTGPQISGLITKINEQINILQEKAIFQQKTTSKSVKGQNKAFVCGKLHLTVLNAQNLANISNGGTPPNVFVQISIQDMKRSSNAKFLDIANEKSFIECKDNSETIVEKEPFKTSIIKQSNNPSWVSKEKPQGECFDLGMFMKKYPHFILIELYHQTPPNSNQPNELLGYTELHSENLISLEDFGQEFYMFLEDSANRSAIVKLRSLFVPSKGTVERLNLEVQKSVFKNAQQFLFYKVLQMDTLHDEFGYQIPTGKYNPKLEMATEASTSTSTQNQQALSSEQNQSVFVQRYEQFSPEHRRHKDLKQKNKLRPKGEENLFCFRQLWLLTQHQNRNVALIDRQRLFWEEYMSDLMGAPGEDEALLDDELKSIRSKLTNTTKMMSSKYRKRARQLKNQQNNAGDGGAKAEGLSQVGENQKKGSKFSVLFVGQWEKNDSWKYVDIWYLVKFGIPQDLRVSLYKDLLRRQIHEQYEYVFYKRTPPYSHSFNANISNYENMKAFALIRDSTFYKQIERDVQEFEFPSGYLANLGDERYERMESERLQLYQVMRVYDLWAGEFSRRRHKVLVYNGAGMLAILQRLLTQMAEEDAFWALIGIVKAFNNVLIFDFKQPPPSKNSALAGAEPSPLEQHQYYSPYMSRRVAFKNEMIILSCIVQLHYPQLFAKLKSLGLPLEWYFYTPFSQFFAYSFSSDLVLRLWDMLIFNLSTNQVVNRKRALWYLLAVPLYMLQTNADLIMQSQSPQEVKQLLLVRTPSLNYNPNLFIDELLQIIKNVFVRKGNVINKLLNLDKANQLESIRRDIEQEAAKRFQDDLALNKKIANHINTNQIELDSALVSNRPDQPQKSGLMGQKNSTTMYDISIQVLGFRSIMLPSLEEETISVALVCGCDEQFQSSIFEMNVPMDNEAALCQSLISKQILLNSIVMGSLEGKKLSIQIDQKVDGIHHHNMGSCQINLDNFAASLSISHHLVLKLSGNQECSNAYIELKIQIQPQKSSIQKSLQQQPFKLSLQGFKKSENDIYMIDKDDEIMKQFLQGPQVKLITKHIAANLGLLNPGNNQGVVLEEKLLRKAIINEQQIQEAMVYTTDAIKSNIASQMQILENRMPLVHQIIQELGLAKEILTGNLNMTQIVTRIVLLGSKIPLAQIFESMYILYFTNLKEDLQPLMTLNDTKLLAIQVFRAALYPLPPNEIWNMIALNDDQSFSRIPYAQVFNVTQQYITKEDPNKNQQSNNFFNKIVSGLTTNNQDKTLFNVTDAFRQTVNQVVRLIGLTQYIPMSVAPFNNIGFWLRGGTNEIKKKQPHYLVVTLLDPRGDRHPYRFKFDAQGIFDSLAQEDGCGAQVIPLLFGASPIIGKSIIQVPSQNTTLFDTMSQIPMLSNFLNQELFLDSQLRSSAEVYVDSSRDFRAIFVDINKTFIFHFSQKVDKQDDFTVDPSQLMRISKGDISQVYKKSKQSDAEKTITIDIWLSSLSRQDTFLSIKERMRAALDFVVQAENMSGAPSLMSTKFQFVKNKANHNSSNQLYNNEDTYYSSMTRLQGVLSERDTELELVRVPSEVYQFKNQKCQINGEDYSSFGLYTHSDGSKEWRPCRIVLKNQQKGGATVSYRVIFEHEADLSLTYTLSREDILLSFAYKRTQEGYYKEEVQEFLEKLDREEGDIAEVLKEQDRRGMQGVGALDEVKRRLQYDNSGGDEGLRVANQDLGDGKQQYDEDEEAAAIRQALKQDEEEGEGSYQENSYYESLK